MNSERIGVGNNGLPENDYARRLALAGHVTAPAIRAAIRDLELPTGSAGLDAACGIGSHALWLAEAIAPHGHVVGLDISEDLLAYARGEAARSEFIDLISFQHGDLNHLPFKDNSFDWAWCSDALYPGGYAVSSDPIPMVRELARAVKPGGKLAIAFWSGHRLLPGYPLLEARLNATAGLHRPFAEGMSPELHFSRVLDWLEVVHIEDPTVITRAADIEGPLTTKDREALVIIFDMLWGGPESEVSSDDWKQFQRLCQLGSEDCVLDLPYYHGFVTYTVSSGRLAR